MKLQVDQRTLVGKHIRKLRKKDKMPAVVYAKHLDNPLLISCRRQDFVKIYRKSGRSTPLTLKGDGVDELVLIHDIQIDPVTNMVLHVDFLGIKKGEKVTTEVPIIVQGVAPITTTGDARIEQVRDYVDVEATPSKLPHELVIDVSNLENIGDVVFLKDINLPAGVVLKEDPELAVVIVAEIKELAEESEDELTLDSIAEEGSTEEEEGGSTESEPDNT